MKKKIGISYTLTKFEGYWNWFSSAELGDDLELIELSFEKNNTEDLYRCDGFILTGGIDIDPLFYQGSTEYPNMPENFAPERDQFEERIFRFAQLHSLPVLAICRGMQLVNVLQGGKLIQDIGDTGNAVHRIENNTDKEHAVNVLPGTLLAELTGVEGGKVNSAHHQAIDPAALGKNLKVSAMAANGSMVEGLEFEDKSHTAFMVCVQWHPERMRDAEENALSLKLKESFLTAVRETTKKKLTVINPATEQMIGEFNEDDLESLQKKYELLNQARTGWQQIALPVRIMIIRKFSELLEKNMDHLAQRLTAESGKPLKQAKNEIRGGRTRIKWLTENAEKYLSDELMNEDGGMKEMIAYEPLGVICNISAWNYPYLVGINVFIPALLAGNTVMYKPSEFALFTAVEIEKLLKQAGVPANAFQVALGKGNVGRDLLALSFDGYYFTGSHKTGKYIYEQVASKMVPCLCEMGGKDPLYVADDVADIHSVAEATADGAFYNNGQSCCAVERIYVHEGIYDAYIREVVNTVRSWKIGSPEEEGNYIGPLTRKEQIAVLEQQISDAVYKGAQTLTGGKPVRGKGYFFEPTVMANVNHQMSIMREESFGPVIGIMKVKNDEEAIRLMQDSEYGLTASVYSADQARAENILRQLNVGTGYWNCCDRVSAALPWSGRKHSGFGVSLSHAGLRAFTRPKAYQLCSG